jgi:hypothetical protein
VSFRILSEPELALAEHEVAVGTCHQHFPLSEWRERIAIGRVGNAEGALPIQPFGEGGGEELPDMDDQENGKREAVGQPAQDLDERRWPARGDPNRDGAQTALSLQRLAFRDGRSERRAAGSGLNRSRATRRPSHGAKPGPWMHDDLDARDELDGGDELLFPGIVGLVSQRLVEHVQGAGRQGFVRLEELSPVRRGGHDENRRRAVGHDEFRDRQATHHGQHHVQGDDVRPQVLAQLDSALAVVGLANDFDVGIGGQHLQHALSNRQGILDHQNTCLRHGYPISVRMVCRSCPWSNSPLTK